MAKNDFDFEFDYEDDYDLEPRADMGSDDTDEFDLSQFGIDMGDLSPEDEESYDDFDFGGLDLGEDAPAEDEELDLSGLDLGIGSDSDPDDPEEPDEEDFDLTPPDPDPEDPDEEDFDLTPPDAGEEDPDDLDAAKQYMTENAYHYALFHKEMNYVTNAKIITEPLYNVRGNIVPGATKYIWN